MDVEKYNPYVRGDNSISVLCGFHLITEQYQGTNECVVQATSFVFFVHSMPHHVLNWTKRQLNMLLRFGSQNYKLLTKNGFRERHPMLGFTNVKFLRTEDRDYPVEFREQYLLSEDIKMIKGTTMLLERKVPPGMYQKMYAAIGMYVTISKAITDPSNMGIVMILRDYSYSVAKLKDKLFFYDSHPTSPSHGAEVIGVAGILDIVRIILLKRGLFTDYEVSGVSFAITTPDYEHVRMKCKPVVSTIVDLLLQFLYDKKSLMRGITTDFGDFIANRYGEFPKDSPETIELSSDDDDEASSPPGPPKKKTDADTASSVKPQKKKTDAKIASSPVIQNETDLRIVSDSPLEFSEVPGTLDNLLHAFHLRCEMLKTRYGNQMPFTAGDRYSGIDNHSPNSIPDAVPATTMMTSTGLREGARTRLSEEFVAYVKKYYADPSERYAIMSSSKFDIPNRNRIMTELFPDYFVFAKVTQDNIVTGLMLGPLKDVVKSEKLKGVVFEANPELKGRHLVDKCSQHTNEELNVFSVRNDQMIIKKSIVNRDSGLEKEHPWVIAHFLDDLSDARDEAINFWFVKTKSPDSDEFFSIPDELARNVNAKKLTVTSIIPLPKEEKKEKNKKKEETEKKGNSNSNDGKRQGNETKATESKREPKVELVKEGSSSTKKTKLSDDLSEWDTTPIPSFSFPKHNPNLHKLCFDEDSDDYGSENDDLRSEHSFLDTPKHESPERNSKPTPDESPSSPPRFVEVKTPEDSLWTNVKSIEMPSPLKSSRLDSKRKNDSPRKFTSLSAADESNQRDDEEEENSAEEDDLSIIGYEALEVPLDVNKFNNIVELFTDDSSPDQIMEKAHLIDKGIDIPASVPVSIPSATNATTSVPNPIPSAATTTTSVPVSILSATTTTTSVPVLIPSVSTTTTSVPVDILRADVLASMPFFPAPTSDTTTTGVSSAPNTIPSVTSGVSTTIPSVTTTSVPDTILSVTTTSVPDTITNVTASVLNPISSAIPSEKEPQRSPSPVMVSQKDEAEEEEKDEPKMESKKEQPLKYSKEEAPKVEPKMESSSDSEEEDEPTVELKREPSLEYSEEEKPTVESKKEQSSQDSEKEKKPNNNESIEKQNDDPFNGGKDETKKILISTASEKPATVDSKEDSHSEEDDDVKTPQYSPESPISTGLPEPEEEEKKEELKGSKFPIYHVESSISKPKEEEEKSKEGKVRVFMESKTMYEGDSEANDTEKEKPGRVNSPKKRKKRRKQRISSSSSSDSSSSSNSNDSDSDDSRSSSSSGNVEDHHLKRESFGESESESVKLKTNNLGEEDEEDEEQQQQSGEEGKKSDESDSSKLPRIPPVKRRQRTQRKPKKRGDTPPSPRPTVLEELTPQKTKVYHINDLDGIEMEFTPTIKRGGIRGGGSSRKTNKLYPGMSSSTNSNKKKKKPTVESPKLKFGPMSTNGPVLSSDECEADLEGVNPRRPLKKARDTALKSALESANFNFLSMETTPVVNGIMCAEKPYDQPTLEYQEKVLELIKTSGKLEIDTKLPLVELDLRYKDIQRRIRQMNLDYDYKLKKLEAEEKMHERDSLNPSAYLNEGKTLEEKLKLQQLHSHEKRTELEGQRIDLDILKTFLAERRHEQDREDERSKYDRNHGYKLQFSFSEVTNGTEFTDSNSFCEMADRMRFLDLWNTKTPFDIASYEGFEEEAKTRLQKMLDLRNRVLENPETFKNYASELTQRRKDYDQSALSMRIKLCRLFERAEMSVFHTSGKFRHHFYPIEDQFAEQKMLQHVRTARYAVVQRGDQPEYFVGDLWEFMTFQNSFPASMIYSGTPKDAVLRIMNQHRFGSKLKAPVAFDINIRANFVGITSAPDFKIAAHPTDTWFRFEENRRRNGAGNNDDDDDDDDDDYDSDNWYKKRKLHKKGGKNSRPIFAGLIDFTLFDKKNLLELSSKNSKMEFMKNKFSQLLNSSERRTSPRWRGRFLNAVWYLHQALVFTFTNIIYRNPRDKCLETFSIPVKPTHRVTTEEMDRFMSCLWVHQLDTFGHYNKIIYEILVTTND